MDWANYLAMLNMLRQRQGGFGGGGGFNFGGGQGGMNPQAHSLAALTQLSGRGNGGLASYFGIGGGMGQSGMGQLGGLDFGGGMMSPGMGSPSMGIPGGFNAATPFNTHIGMGQGQGIMPVDLGGGQAQNVNATGRYTPMKRALRL